MLCERICVSTENLYCICIIFSLTIFSSRVFASNNNTNIRSILWVRTRNLSISHFSSKCTHSSLRQTNVQKKKMLPFYWDYRGVILTDLKFTASLYRNFWTSCEEPPLNAQQGTCFVSYDNNNNKCQLSRSLMNIAGKLLKEIKR